VTVPRRVDPTRLGGELTATNFDGWTEPLRADFAEHANNDVVGSVLLSETERVRVWSISLAPVSDQALTATLWTTSSQC
jgi:hypothetical protein